MRPRVQIGRVAQQQPKRELTTLRDTLAPCNIDDDLDGTVRVALRLVPELVELRELLCAHLVVHRDVVVLHVRPEVQLLRAEVSWGDEEDLHIET